MKLYTSSMAILLVFAVSAMHGQTPGPANTVPLCKPANVDATFSFADVPAGHQTIGIHLHNVTPQSCRLRGELAPSFAVHGHGTRVETCWLCAPDGRPDAETIRLNDDFVLPGDGYAQVTYRWSSVGEACQNVDWASIGVEWEGRANFLFQNRHWRPHICSAMQISGYEPDAIAPPRPTVTLKVSAPPVPIYADELVQLTLELSSQHEIISPSKRCPELYAVYRDPSNSTRFEAILPDGYGFLVHDATETPSLSFSSGSDELPEQFKNLMRLCATAKDLDTTTVTVPASLKAPIHVVPQPTLDSVRHIVWRAEHSNTHEPVFVTADVHFDVLDPDILPQNWGPQIEGIGVGLSIDKTNFTLGETIPLHIRWENFSASKKLAVGECGGPEPQVEIQDASHQVLGTLTDYDMGCMGHGWGPFAVEAGKPNRNFVSLRYSKMGYFISPDAKPITAPGVYYLVTVWSPSTLVEVMPDENGLIAPGVKYEVGKRYATARSLPIRIEILPSTN